MTRPKTRFVLITSAVLVLVVTIFAVWFFSAEPYIVKIGTHKVGVPEFYVYLYEQKKMFEERGGTDIWEMDFDGQPASNIAKQNALNTLSLIKLTSTHAKETGVSLTASEKESALLDATDFYASIDSTLASERRITLKLLGRIMQESDLYNKVYAEMTKNYVISENDFDRHFDTYYEENKKSLIDIKLSIIYVKTDVKEAENLYATLEDSADFSELAATFPYKPSANLSYSTLADNLEPEIIEAAHNTKLGHYSELITTANGYYIIRVDEIIPPNIPALTEQERQNYTEQKKYEVFRAEYAKWSEKTTILRNTKIWAAISIHDLDILDIH